MADISWNLLQTPQALDPITAMHYGAADDAVRQNAVLAQQKQAAALQAQAAAAAARQQAATLWASGNTRGAQGALIGAGDNDTLTGLNTSEKQDVDLGRAGTGEFAGVVKAIGSLPYDQRKGAITAIAPHLIANHDVSQADIDAFDPTDANISALAGYGYSAKDQDTNVRDNAQTVINAQNANTQQSAETRLERTPTGIALTDNAYVPGGPLAGGSAAPAGAAPAPVTTGTPVSIRNNNPGALRPDGHSNWQGATGVKDGFLVFDSPENGARAQIINLQNQQRLHGINTIDALVTRYAPASDNNDPASYAATVAKAIGVGVNDPINLMDPTVAAHVAQAMARVESGGSPSRPQAGSQAGPLVGSNSGPALVGSNPQGPTLIQSGVPKADPADFSVPGDLTKNGDAYLSTVPAQYRPLIQAIADGRSAPPTSRTKANLELLGMVTQFDPTFDAANAKSRMTTRVDFTSGASAKTINKLNTAVGHAYELYNDADRLGNFGGVWTSLNSVVNPVREQMGNTTLPSFRQNAGLYADELESAYRQAGGTEAQIKEFQNNLSTSSDPRQIKAVIHGMISQLKSKLSAMGAQYEQGMGRSDSTVSVISPENGKKMRAMGVQPDQQTAAAQPQRNPQSAPASGGPAHVSNAADYHALRSGTVYVDPAGHVRKKP